MDRHPLAGETVSLNVTALGDGLTDGCEFTVEDWWINVGGRSWMDSVGNPACLQYAARAGVGGLPTDDRVLYGKVGPYGHLVHESELGAPVTEGSLP